MPAANRSRRGRTWTPCMRPADREAKISTPQASQPRFGHGKSKVESDATQDRLNHVERLVQNLSDRFSAAAEANNVHNRHMLAAFDELRYSRKDKSNERARSPPRAPLDSEGFPEWGAGARRWFGVGLATPVAFWEYNEILKRRRLDSQAQTGMYKEPDRTSFSAYSGMPSHWSRFPATDGGHMQKSNPQRELQALEMRGEYPFMAEQWVRVQDVVFSRHSPLPTGWIRCWSRSNECVFYVRTADNYTTFDFEDCF